MNKPYYYGTSKKKTRLFFGNPKTKERGTHPHTASYQGGELPLCTDLSDGEQSDASAYGQNIASLVFVVRAAQQRGCAQDRSRSPAQLIWFDIPVKSFKIFSNRCQSCY